MCKHNIFDAAFIRFIDSYKRFQNCPRNIARQLNHFYYFLRLLVVSMDQKIMISHYLFALNHYKKN